jgi:YD repeat-containing protein
MEVNRDPLPQAGIGGNPEPQGSYVTYADREYVWGPDYVDECLWQVDRPGATAFVVQDANFNVVALVDPQGQLLRQYDYDPYGQPIAADNLGAFGHNRIGHQGLFADRFDADAPAADLAVGAELLYYARNRDYSPRLGRWVQADPNGTGQTVLPAVAYAGRGLAAKHAPFDIQAVYSDGGSRYAFVGASPTTGVDPAGLFGIAGILMTGFDMAGAAAAAVGEAQEAYSLTHSVQDFIDAVAARQIFDVEWALDMESPDDWYSGSPANSQARSSGAEGPAMAAAWMDWGRGRAGHGGRWHNAMSRAWAEYYRTKFGPQNVRFNQALVDANGKTVSRLRPDVQAYDAKKGRWFIIEIEDSNVRGKEGNRERRAALARALGVPVSDVSYRAIGRNERVPGPVGRMMRTKPWSKRP